ncbi:MAG: S8 family serine peptidase [Opitutaceae bacterium]
MLERRIRAGLYAARVNHPRDIDALPNLINLTKVLDEPEVLYAEPDYLRFASEILPDDPRIAEQWALGSGPGGVRAFEAWETRATAPNVIVAVIDSGMDRTHNDLRANLWINADEIENNGLDDDGNGYIDDKHGIGTLDEPDPLRDDAGHGTAVAGVIGARGNNGLGISGVAWEVQLMPLKFLGGDGSGLSSDQIECIDYAIENGASIINASYGGAGHSLAVLEALERVQAADILFVAAAGNNSVNIDLEPIYPAAYGLDCILTIASLDPDGKLSDFSNYGIGTVDLAAPGKDILSTARTGENYQVVSGTSFAAPMVSGAAALLRAAFPDDSASVLTSRLVTERDSKSDLEKWVRGGATLNLITVLEGSEQAPPNDAFQYATTIDPENAKRTFSLRNTSLEPGEPNPPGATLSRSVWFWRPRGDNDLLTIEANSPSGTIGLALYEGDELQRLTKLESAYSAFPGQTVRITRSMEIWQSPYIAVYGSDDADALVELRLVRRPANDDLSAAFKAADASFWRIGSNEGATHEKGEPVHHGVGTGHSVWWEWIAPRSGPYYLDTVGSGTDTVLAVYTGSDPGNLTQIVANDNDSGQTSSEVSFQATAGTAYKIAIDTARGNPGPFHLTGRYADPPAITRQPKDIQVTAGEHYDLSVIVSGMQPIDYQWYHNGEPVVGLSSNIIGNSSARESDAGIWKVTASNASGSVTSREAEVVVLGAWPQFTRHPQDTRVAIGDRLVLSVAISGEGALSYQWYANLEPLDGENGPTLIIQNAQAVDSGAYHVVATNPHGSATSRTAHVQVTAERPEAWIPVASGPKTLGTVIFDDMDGELVALDDEGLFHVWQGGDAWETRSVGMKVPLVSTAGGTGRYVISSRSGILFESTDGFSWTEHETPNTLFSQIAHGAGVFVAVAQTGSIHVSATAGSWTESRASSKTPSSVAVTFFADRFIAAMTLLDGMEGEVVAFTSEDGVEWEEQSLVSRGGMFIETSLQFFETETGLVLIPTLPVALRTLNGTDWALVDKDKWTPTIAYGASKYLAIYDNTLETSADLVNWKSLGPNPFPWFRAATHRAGNWFVNRSDGSIQRIESLDPFTYPSLNPITFLDTLDYLEFIDNEFVAIGGTQLHSAYMSGNGLGWHQANIGRGTTLSFGNRLFVTEFNIARHPDLLLRFPLEGHSVTGGEPLMAFGHGRHVRLESGSVQTTETGQTWTRIDLPVSRNWTRFMYAAERFVAVSDTGDVLVGVSPDDWSVNASGHSGPLTGICHGQSRFMVTTESGALLESTDAVSWTPIDTEHDCQLFDIAFGDGRFVAVGERCAMVSVDRANWSRIDPGGPDRTLTEVAFGSGVFLAGDTNGRLYRLTPKSTHSPEISYKRTSLLSLIHPYDPVEYSVEGFDPGGEAVSVDVELDGVDVSIHPIEEGAYSFSLRSEKPGNRQAVIRAINQSGLQASSAFVFEVQAPQPDALWDPDVRFGPAAFFKGFEYRGQPDGSIVRRRPSEAWQRMRTPSAGTMISDVVAGGDLLAARNYSGAVYFCHNGIDWEEATTEFYEIRATGRSILGKGKDGYVYATDDGVTWNRAAPALSSAIQVIDFRSWNLLLTDRLYVSEDGLDFAPHSDSRFSDLLAMAEVGDRICLFSRSGYCYVSSDLTAWTANPLPVTPQVEGPPGTFTYLEWQEVRHSGDRAFLWADWGQTHGSRRYESVDGVTWTEVKPDLSPKAIELDESVTYLLEKELILISDGPGRWSFAPLARPEVLQWMETGPREDFGTYVDIPGTHNLLRIYRDPVSAEILGTTSTATAAMAWNADTLVALSNDVVQTGTTNRSIVNTQPAEWRSREVGIGFAVRAMAASPTRFVAVGDAHQYATSINGMDWVTGTVVEYQPGLPASHPFSRELSWVYYLEEARLFVAGSSSLRAIGTFTSADGINWTHHPNAPNERPAVCDGNRIIMAGSSQAWLTDDGMTWREIDRTHPERLIGQGNSGRFFSYSDQNGVLIVSHNGETWTPAMRTDTGGAFAGKVVATDLNPMAVLSGDAWTTEDLGLTWSRIDLDVPFGMEEAAQRHYVRGRWFRDLGFARGEDIAITRFEVENETLGPGDRLQVKFDLTNNSPYTLNQDAAVDFLLAREPVWRGDAPRFEAITTIDLSAVPPGSTATISVSGILPGSIQPGPFYIGIQIDALEEIHEVCESNNYAFTRDTPLRLVAWALDLKVEGNGAIRTSEPGPRYRDGTSILLTAVPDPGNTFVGWVEESTGGSDTITVAMDRDRSVTARFERGYRLSTYRRGSGSISLSPDKGIFRPGETVTITAHPAEGWAFVGWTGDHDGTDSEIEETMDLDRSLTAVFHQTFNLYRELVFSPDEQLDPAISGPDADMDGDGASNLAEFLLLGDPTDPGTAGSIIAASDRDYVRIAYLRRRHVSDYSVRALASVDLINWSTTGIEETLTPNASGHWEIVEARIPRIDNTAIFLCLFAEPTQPSVSE